MYKEYQAVVNHQLTLSPESWNFKSNPTYRNILEHVSKGQALDYLELSSKKVDLKDFIKLFNKNDLYGRPIKEGLGSEIGSASPTNARYLYHSLLIKDHYEKFETKNDETFRHKKIEAHVEKPLTGKGNLEIYWRA